MSTVHVTNIDELLPSYGDPKTARPDAVVTEVRRDKLGFWCWTIFDGSGVRFSFGGHETRRAAESALQRWVDGGRCAGLGRVGAAANEVGRDDGGDDDEDDRSKRSRKGR